MRFERKDWEFVAKDKGGRSYTIEVWVEQIPHTDRTTGLYQVLDGAVEMRTAGGEEVHYDSPGVYLIRTRYGEVEVAAEEVEVPEEI
jgi:hypothetical protein